jgi:hypothetical protein
MGVNLSYRPPEDRIRRYQYVGIHVLPEEHATIMKAAARNNKAASVVGRQLLLRWADAVLSGRVD